MDTSKWCTATHPNMPNNSGNARGRKLHKTKDGKKTFCNMNAEIIDEIAKFHFYTNGRCKICFKQKKDKQ